MNRKDVSAWIAAQYGIDPDCPFEGDGETHVFRRRENRKWFALMMRIPASRLGLSGEETVLVVNLKCDPALIGSLTDFVHVFPAYHMNRNHWISVRPDQGLTQEQLAFLFDMSYRLTGPKQRKRR